MSDNSLTETIGELFTDFGEHSAVQAAPLPALALAMTFGTVIFAASALGSRSFLTADMRPFVAAQDPKSQPLKLSSFSSLYSFLHHISIFGLLLFYAYICEFHPPFPHSNKSYDRDEFFFMTAILIVASVYSWQRNDKGQPAQQSQPDDNDSIVAPVNAHTDILNRAQTEEWKGWMQYVFLLYHYYHAEEVYNTVRILITCYVWMTGFGNFSFFYLKGDYSIVRFLHMMWRLNFLVVFLCLTQGTTYILYYICLLHTYYFLMVYITMKTASNLNYSKWGLRTKLALTSLIIAAVWDFDLGLFKAIHFPFFGDTPMLGAQSGSMWEWYFRSTLDHWSTFLGMIFALNHPITSLFFRKLEAQPVFWEFMAKGVVGVALVGAFWVWMTGPFQQGKHDYNQTNAYFGFIPLITYIYLRNLTPWLRSHSMFLLHQIGKTTLETYLLQHHIWLTSNAKSLLTLIPGWPKLNMFVVTVIFYLVARRLQHLTLYLRGIVLPPSQKQCVRNLVIMFGVMFGFYAVAFALKSFGIMSLTAVGVVCVSCGFLLYQSIMEFTWEEFKESAYKNRKPTLEETMLEKMVGNGASQPKYDTPINAVAAPVVGAMVVFLLGTLWHGMAQVGATHITKLPEGCAHYINQGSWVPVDPCNEEAIGAGYRKHGVSSFATCSATGNTFVWGWNETFSSTHCRFTQRDVSSLRKLLDHRTITFVGDSMTRHLYHATLRQIGMAGSGAYNTKISKWSDITNTIGDTTMEFEWAALAADQVIKLKDIMSRPDEMAEDKTTIKPDMVVMGGGAWDRLHVYATDEDRESHRATVKDLAKEIQMARSSDIPVVWVVPTTINSKALVTEEKQKNIKEEDMKGMRALYSDLGVLSSASFVLDGPSFTRQRVSESYDGVHYPLSVYDAGAQILMNAMDWLLLELKEQPNFSPPGTGSMSNPALGMMMLCFVFMGLVCFDGFMGFSYLASFFVRGVMPSDLCDEAFDELYDRVDVPSGSSYHRSSGDTGSSSRNSRTTRTGGSGRSAASGNYRSSAKSVRSSKSNRTKDSGRSGRTSASGRSSKGSSVPSRHSGKSSAGGSVRGGSSTGSQGSIDDEIAALLGTTSKRLEMAEMGEM